MYTIGCKGAKEWAEPSVLFDHPALAYLLYSMLVALALNGIHRRDELRSCYS